MTFQWFLSPTVRHATAMRKHVQKLLNHQRDILPPQHIEKLNAAMANLRQAVEAKADNAELEKQMQKLEEAANNWLKPYPNPVWRENIEVLLVALAVAMGIRTFFLQPFKIPTGSMQPTLYGVTSENLKNNPGFKVPTGWERVRQWFAGVSYVHVVAENDGELEGVEPPVRLLIFNIKQTLWVGGKSYTLWFPPDWGAPPAGSLEVRAELQRGQPFHKGDDIVKLKIAAGDHLFVDRVSFNFRTPDRGEIVVFETKGIEGLPQDQFYIKRLVGLGGENLCLQQDFEVKGVDGSDPEGVVPVGHLVVNGKPLSASTPHFESLYSYWGAPTRARGQAPTNVLTYVKDHYFGHAMIRNLASSRSFQVQTNHFFVMGDNTMNSLDSRYWGDFPSSQAIGKSFFVYWPITERFGWGYH
jgi:signal peptidase I